jgi:hypothetical protein
LSRIAADVGGARLEHSETEQTEHRHQREVERLGRFPRGGQQRLELQV